MKRTLALLLALLMLCGTCLAEGLDYQSMTDEQLHAVINSARSELAKRELIAADKTVLFEQEGVTIYISGDYTVREGVIGDAVYLEIKLVVVNETDRNVGISIENPSVNGWDISAPYLSGVSAQKKAKDTLKLNVADAEVKTAEDLEDLTLSFRLYDADSYKTFFEGEPITLHFNVQ